MKRNILFLLLILLLTYASYHGFRIVTSYPSNVIGSPIDSFNNVVVYYNGKVDNVIRRSTKNGYNLGLEFQCVEFVKRYYFEYYNHRMPNSYGHAFSFYDKTITDGNLNKQRNLLQFSNPSHSKPKEGDLVIMMGNLFNRYGHVAIISKVGIDKIEIIQQNPGPYSPSRFFLKLVRTTDGKWRIVNDRLLGWLRK